MDFQITECFRSLLSNIDEKRKMILLFSQKKLILSTVAIILIRALSKLIFYEQRLLLKTTAGGRVLELDEEKSGKNLKPLCSFSHWMYSPKLSTFLASLLHMGMMLNRVTPAITWRREVGQGQQGQDNTDMKEVNPHNIWKQTFLLSSG